MTQHTIVFDLDGTLVDTAPDLVNTLNVVLAAEGLPPASLSEARRMVGGGARRLIENALAAAGRVEPADRIDLLQQDFIAHYAEHIADRSRVFPGVEEALGDLASGGWRLAVCTNKLEWLSLRLLDALGLTSRFAFICGADTFGMAKPNPHGLQQTILKVGGRPDRAIMVGDSITDVATARAAGVPVIGVDFGYSEVPIAELNPDRTISHFHELTAAVAELTARAGAAVAGPLPRGDGTR